MKSQGHAFLLIVSFSLFAACGPKLTYEIDPAPHTLPFKPYLLLLDKSEKIWNLEIANYDNSTVPDIKTFRKVKAFLDFSNADSVNQSSLAATGKPSVRKGELFEDESLTVVASFVTCARNKYISLDTDSRCQLLVKLANQTPSILKALYVLK